ncbi:hypothetical protein J3U66_06805 [Gilliamella sp. B2969]|uniref:hypothetical protein n=1 Tax=Gilliamella sp. B2969 TaxID=2818021 RepID=UPI00226A390C|nr:hypothetical protein [Gilliamella sp. B2969]MCX8730086.1 hypothetical protein [Gilliamella sp. B2969]
MVLIGHRASGIGHRASGIGHRASGIGHRALLDSLVTTSHRVSGLSSHLSTFISFFTFLKFLYFLKHFSSIISLNNSYVKDYFKLIQSTLAQCSLLIFFILLTIHPAQALSTLTAKAIEGNAPEVINTVSAANNHGFRVGGVFYSEASKNLKGNVVKEFDDDSLTLKDFRIQEFGIDTLKVGINYRDKDGDKVNPYIRFLIDDTSYKWYDSNGKVITDLSQKLGCGGGYSLPLTLEITTSAKTVSTYGIPNESDNVPITKRYQISFKPQVCYAKPYAIEKMPQFQWLSFDSSNTFVAWNDSRYTSRTAVGGGYTADYVPNKGFKTNPTESGGKTFPTTGFSGAKFQLIVAGVQTDYSFSIPNNPGGQVAIDQQGYVLLKGKPTGNVTVRATLKRDPTIKFDYTFNPTSVWANPLKDFFDIWSVAIQRCSINNLLSYSELTNTPVDDRLNGSFEIINGYTRAIGQGLLPEWGYSTQQTYPDSTWRDEGDRYWTKDLYYQSSYGTHIDVNSSSGLLGVDADAVGAPDYLVCRQ